MDSIVDPPPDSKTDPRVLLQRLRSLRAEAEGIASALAAFDLPTSPIEIAGDGQRVWHDDRVARVHVIDNCVFISGRKDWMHWPDWTALRPIEARNLGAALLAAAADLRPELAIV